MVKNEYEWILDELNRIYEGLIEYEHLYVIEGWKELKKELTNVRYSNKETKLSQDQAERIREWSFEMKSDDFSRRSIYLQADGPEENSILYLAQPNSLEVVTEEFFHAVSPLPPKCDEAYVPFAKYLILKSAENEGTISLKEEELFRRCLGNIKRTDRGYLFVYDPETEERKYLGRRYTSQLLSYLELSSLGKKLSQGQREMYSKNLFRMILQSDQDCEKVLQHELKKLKSDGENYLQKLI